LARPALVQAQAQAARFNESAALFQPLGGGWWSRQQIATKAAFDADADRAAR
jgi:hypothetical protein